MAGYTIIDDKTADHGVFGGINDDAWLELIVEQIEMETPVFEQKSTSEDCSGNQADSAKMMALGGAVTLTMSAASFF